MLKKYLVLLISLAILTPLFADILLDENFDSVTVPNMPSGWVVNDANSDSKTWATTTSHPRTLPNCIRYNYSTVNAANDWFYTNGLVLQTGITYSLEFFYRASNPFFTEKLKVFTDNNQTPGGGTQILDLPTIINTIYQQGLVDFTVGSNGTYYLGFQCVSLANQWNLRIDDIKVYKKVHDVGVDSILVPKPITYNASTPITPSVRVRNWGQNTGGEVNFWVYGMILWYGSDSTYTSVPSVVYRDSFLLPRIEICTPEIVTFNPWQPQACYHKFVSWTALSDDINRANDSSKVNFAVDFRDVALHKIVIPRDTMLWCTESIPTDTVWNKGHRIESFWTFFQSKDSAGAQEYYDSTYVTSLAPGEKRRITFKKWHFPVCNHTAKSWTALVGDENRSNDTLAKPYVIKYYDFEVIKAYDIPDTAQVCNWYFPKMIVHNNGRHTGPQSAIAHMNVYRNGILINSFATQTRTLVPCTNDTIGFEWHADSACNHVIKAWVEYPPDQNHANDTVWKNFVVKYYDVEAISILNVPDTVNVCNDVTAKVVVHNKGIHVGPQTGWVYFYLYRDINGPTDPINPYVLIKKDSLLKTLTPCVNDTATFTFHADSACNHKIIAKVKYPFDQDPSNDSVIKYFVIRYNDFNMVSIYNIPDTFEVHTVQNAKVVVHNNGIHTGPQDYRLYYKITREGADVHGGYHDGYGLLPCHNDTIDIPFTETLPSNHQFIAWVQAAGDQNPLNDTLKKNFVVTEHDVEAVSILNVPDTIQYCNSIYPKIVVHNKGVHVPSQTGWVVYEVLRSTNGITYNTVYKDSVLKTLAYCVYDTVTFQYHPDTCWHRVTATVRFNPDHNMANNTVSKDFVVRYSDVEAVSILNVPDTIDFCNNINPKIVVHNKGSHVPTQTGWVIYSVLRSHNMVDYYPIFTDSVQKTLAYCVYDTVTFSYHPDSACWHRVKATVRFNPDQDTTNNKVSKDFVVRLYDFEIVRLKGIPDTIEQCNWFNPTVVIHNNGVHTGLQPSTIKLQVYRNGLPYGPLLQHAMPPLEPCHNDSFTFEIHADSFCNHMIKAWVEAPVDQNNTNDTMWKNYVVTYHDVEAVSVLNIPDTIDFCNTIYPKIVVHNKGQHVSSQTGWVIYQVLRSTDHVTYNPVYTDSVEKTLAYCVYDTVMFQYHPDTCWHRVTATVRFNPDQNSANNTVSKDFVVRYRDAGITAIVSPGTPSDTILNCQKSNITLNINYIGSHVGPAPCSLEIKIWRMRVKMDSLCKIVPLTDPITGDTICDTIYVGKFDTIINPGTNIITLDTFHPYWADIFKSPLYRTHHGISARLYAFVGDQNPANNALTKSFIVKQRPYDLQVSYVGLLKQSVIPVPEGESLGISYAYNAVATVSNSTPATSFRLWYKIVRDRDNNIVYSRYVDKTLGTWTYACIYPQSGWVPTDTGWYTINCWLQFRPGVDSCLPNNSLSKKYYVKSLPSATNKNTQGSVIGLPKTFAMYQNNPNPFNGLTHIRWQIPVQANVTISVYDASGRVIKTLVNEKRTPGYYNTTWNCTDENNRKVSASVYFYEMKSNDYTSRRKMVITH